MSIEGELLQLVDILSLSETDLARALNAPDELVIAWLHGREPVPEDYVSTIEQAYQSLKRIQQLIRKESIASVIRQSAPAFAKDGPTALEWICKGRIAQVADAYEGALSYQW